MGGRLTGKSVFDRARKTRVRAGAGRSRGSGLTAVNCPPAGGRKDWLLTMIMDRIALIISIIGALNWGSIGLFRFDIVAWICGGASTLLARIIYTVVALAGIWCISLLFRQRDYDGIEETREVTSN